MKKIIFGILISVSAYSYSQVGIGRSTVSPGAILEFQDGTTAGIILPIVETLPTNNIDGTILMDSVDKKVKMRQNGQWVDLTAQGSLNGITLNPTPDKGDGVVIGPRTDSTPSGVLVLESTNKGLVLPKISEPETNVKSPYPGMMCYDIKSKTIAIFDGTVWNYWK